MSEERINTVARPIIYLATFLLIGIPLIYPVGLPIKVSQSTIDFYNQIESMPEGSVVIMNFNVETFGWDELESQLVSITKHLISRPVKVIYVSDMALGPAFIEKTLKMASPQIEKHNKEYGQDYVIAGYLAGESAVAAIASDFHKLISVDYYGHSVEGTFLDDVKDGSDIDLVISVDCFGGTSPYIRHFYLSFGTPILTGTLGGGVPSAINNVQVGQIKSYLGGIPGGAEFEYLSGFPGVGITSSDAMTIVHLMGIALIILGNIVLLSRKIGGRV